MGVVPGRDYPARRGDRRRAVLRDLVPLLPAGDGADATDARRAQGPRSERDRFDPAEPLRHGGGLAGVHRLQQPDVPDRARGRERE